MLTGTRSDPSSPNYAKYWTPEEVVEAFKPSDNTVDTVREWLTSAGIDDSSITVTENKAWLAFYATTSQAEELLHTEYFEHEDKVSGGVMPACDQYHVPHHIAEHVDYITPGVKLLAPVESMTRHGGDLKRSLDTKAKRTAAGRVKLLDLSASAPHNASDLSICDETITPACVAALYQIPKANLTPSAKNHLGIFESELQYWTQVDLDTFFTNFTTHIPNGTHPISRLIDGGVASTRNLTEAGGETLLDLQLAYPIVYPQKIELYNVDDLYYQAELNDTYTWGFNTLLDAIDGSYCNYSAFGETGDAPGIDPEYPDPRKGGYKGKAQCGIYKPTNVLSLSYGGQEAGVAIAYQKRQCNEYLKLGLQGVSILFASGDAGVGDYPAPYGFSGKTGCIGKKGNVFNPTWPNTCPYITNVGATKVYPGFTVYQPESGVFDPAGAPYHVNYSSGGGFSNLYAIPKYQQSAVATYFANHSPPYPYYSKLAGNAKNPTMLNVTELVGNTGGLYNRIGRGVPDVAANGDNIAVNVGGEFARSGGTSASTPLFAAIVNRLIEERLAIGKKPLGFLNPAMYAHPYVFNDIVNGSNPDCGTNGFSAVPGWDPVTGLGTPNYPKMRQLFVNQLP